MDIAQALATIAKDIVIKLKNELDSRGMNASGKLKKSIEYAIGDNFLVVQMNHYGSYLDTGTKYKSMTSKEKSKMAGWLSYYYIKPWTKLKGIDTKYSWAIAYSIIDKGIPTNSAHDNRGWIDIKTITMGIDKKVLQAFSTIIDDKIDKKITKVFQWQ